MELVLWERCVISANNAQLFTDKIRHVTCARWRGSSARPSASRDNFSSADTTLLYFVSEKIDLVAVLDRLKCVVILLREVIQLCLSDFKMAVGAKRSTREIRDHHGILTALARYQLFLKKSDFHHSLSRLWTG